MTRQTISVRDAGKVLGLGANAAYRAVKAGDIPSIKLGGKIVVPLPALEKMLQGNQREENASLPPASDN